MKKFLVFAICFIMFFFTSKNYFIYKQKLILFCFAVVVFSCFPESIAKVAFSAARLHDKETVKCIEACRESAQ